MRKTRPAEERFFENAMPEPNSGCWIWIGSCTSKGYGQFGYKGMNVPAHRWGYEHLVGQIPSGLQLDHLCRVRCCVNPAHLEVVSSRTNVLRGVGVTAMNAKKTHCPQGHPYAGDNLYIYPHGGRGCRECNRKAGRAARRLRSKP